MKDVIISLNKAVLPELSEPGIAYILCCSDSNMSVPESDHILLLHFQDIIDDKRVEAFSSEQAEQIVHFWKQICDNEQIECVFVCCDAGMSRSPAIAAALMRELGQNDDCIWSDAEYDKFYSDCWDCLCELHPEIFRDENITMSAEHYDEGLPVTEEGDSISRHMHRIGFARDAEGHWCGNKIDAKMLHDLNAVFPSMMRQRGWTEMEDLDVTDFDRMKEDEEYRKERLAKRKQAGRSVNQYSESKRRKKLQEASELLEEVEQMHGEAALEKEEAKQLRREAFIEKKQAIKRGVELAEEKKKTIIDDASKQRDLIIDEAEAEKKSVIETALSDADAMKKNISRMYDEHDGNMSGKVMHFLKTMQLVVKKDSLKEHIDAVLETVALNRDTLNQIYELAKQKKMEKSLNHLDDIVSAFASKYDYGDWDKER